MQFHFPCTHRSPSWIWSGRNQYNFITCAAYLFAVYIYSMHLALPPEGARFLLWCHNMISILQNLNSVNICISFLFGGKINNYLDSQYFRRYGTVPWQIQLSYKCMLVHTMSLLILCCFMLDCFWGMHYTVHIHITVLFIYILSLSASLQVPPLSQSLCTEVTRSKRILIQCLSVSNDKDVITAMAWGQPFCVCLVYVKVYTALDL